MINDFDISAIENEVIDIVRGCSVSNKVYPNRPKSAESVSDFVVVSTTNGVEDRAAYGECVVRIDLFAKDINSIKNSKKLSVMYQRLRKGFPAASGRLLFDTEWDVLGDTPDDFGFHARIIRIHTTIKAI
jgi:hypothetical protein